MFGVFLSMPFWINGLGLPQMFLINENLPEDAGSLFQKMTYYQ
jgi:hypothetical protein